MRLLLPLTLKPIARLWSGLAASAAGDQLGSMAVTWAAVQVLGARAGYLTALQALVTLLAALLIGGWVDGRNQRRIMIAADCCRAVVLLAAVLLWGMVGHPTVYILTGVTVVLAIGEAAFRPAVQAILPGIAPADLLPAANALLDATDRLARLVGPLLVIAMASVLPVKHFLTMDAVSFLISAGAVVLIGPLPMRFDAQTKVSLKQALSRGFRAMRRHRLLGFLLATSGLLNGAWYAAMFLGLPLILAHSAHAPQNGLRAFGTVIACYGVANLLGNLLIGGRPLPAFPGIMILSGNILTGVGIVAMGVIGAIPGISISWIYIGAAVAGFGGPMNDIPRSTLMQTALSPDDVAAAFRAWMVMANAGKLVAMLAAPALFSAVGGGVGVAVCGSAMVVGGMWGLFNREVRRS
jgi:MFS transporter, DHA3 family, macrolide efflux protein